MTECPSPAGPLVLFTVAGSRWAVPVQTVERVILAVEITPPAAPPLAQDLMGTINVSGTTVPVYDLSREGAAREIVPEDMILLVHTRQGLAGFWAGEVEGVVQPTPGDLGAEPRPAPGGAEAEQLAIRLP